LLRCEWFRLYDLIEDLYSELDFHDTELRNEDEDFQSYPFQQNLNEYFEHAGIGWKLAEGKIVARGDDGFEHTVRTAESELKAGGRVTAADCIEDAIRNLSFRPKPRLGAAVGRATNAMECVLHDITSEKKMGFGDYLQSYPDLFPGGLSKTLGGLWGYASNEGARHGKEGVEPPREEAEFIVGIAAALTTYLNRKHPRDSSG
jgi:AbiJ N-terminal domain 4